MMKPFVSITSFLSAALIIMEQEPFDSDQTHEEDP